MSKVEDSSETSLTTKLSRPRRTDPTRLENGATEKSESLPATNRLPRAYNNEIKL